MYPTYKSDPDFNNTHKLTEKDFREKYIAEIARTIEDPAFVKANCNRDKINGFTRKRKISFIHLIVLLTQGLSRSLQRELNSFYQQLKGEDFSFQEVTKSAFSHARAKLKPEAFMKLNQVANEIFYSEAPFLKWKGFRLLSIDGSTMVLPNHPSIVQEFGTFNFGAGEGKPRTLGRISMLYDVLNFTTLNAEINGFDVSERDMALDHMKFLKPGLDVIILDRGYPSIGIFYEFQQMGVHFCVRMQHGWYMEVRKMIEEGEKDKIVRFKLHKRDYDLLEKFNTDCNEVTCRLLVLTLPGGGLEILCTSLLDKEEMPYDDFMELYRQRWNIEEGFKLYKCRVGIEAFSGKTAIAVLQDFYAKVFMMTTMAILAFPVEEKLKKEQQRVTKRKNKYKVNRTNALAMLKEITIKIFIKKVIRRALEAFDNFLLKTPEIVRPNRTVERPSHKKRPPSMAYKPL